MQEQLAVNIPEAARRLGLSIRTIATLVSRRELASRKVGRRRIIPVAALEAFIRGCPRAVRAGPTEAEGECGSTG
jgi:excisionase family DNA binding protein